MKKRKKVLLITMIISSIVAAIILTLLLKSEDSSLELQEKEANAGEQDLGNDLSLVEIGKYSGQYVEDGSDENVSDILMMKVANRGEEAIEYAVIQIPLEDKVAEFTVSALMPGAEAILLEKNRMAFDSAVDYENKSVILANFAKYQYDLMLYEDKVGIQVLDGAVNVTNISEETISENVTIYYKNKDDGVFLGGIAYRITIEGGIRSGEIRQKMAKHLSEANSEILFVTLTK